MSPELKLVMKGVPIHIVVGDDSLSLLTISINRERASLGLIIKAKSITKATAGFLDDWKLALELRLSGMKVSEISSKWNISKYNVQVYMKPWVDWHQRNISSMFTMTEFRKHPQLPDSFVISIRDIATYKVVRI